MNNDPPRRAADQQLASITAQQFTAKYQSKPEVYRFLATEVGAYLSSYNTVTIWHLRDLCAGKRRIVMAKDVKQIHVPQFEGLTTEDMLKFARAYPAVGQALPAEPREVEKLLRSYIANLCFSHRRALQAVDGRRHGGQEPQDRG